MKFFKLSAHDRSLSWQALPLVIEVRWRLWRTKFPVLHAQWRAQVQAEMDAADARGVALDNETEPDRRSIDEVWDCVHAVRRVAMLVPMASCLTQAMALQLLLARHGHHCAVCIGVGRRKPGQTPLPTDEAPSVGSEVVAPDVMAHGSDVADGRFRAHAWVEWRGRVVIGGDVRRWKPLTIFAPVNAPSASSGAPSP